MLIKIEDIQRFLPHRYPFLLVDRVLEMERGKSITGLKNVTVNEPFFQGHFPQLKVMPGVLIIEALAQCGGILIYHSIEHPDKKISLLSKIENAKFRKPVVPGDQLILKAEVIKMKGRFIQMATKAYVQDEVVAEGEVMAYLVDLEEMNERR